MEMHTYIYVLHIKLKFLHVKILKLKQVFFSGFSKTIDHRPTDYQPTDPSATYPPTSVKIKDQILTRPCFAFYNS